VSLLVQLEAIQRWSGDMSRVTLNFDATVQPLGRHIANQFCLGGGILSDGNEDVWTCSMSSEACNLASSSRLTWAACSSPLSSCRPHTQPTDQSINQSIKAMVHCILRPAQPLHQWLVASWREQDAAAVTSRGWFDHQSPSLSPHLRIQRTPR